jgi:hypothetical protein
MEAVMDYRSWINRRIEARSRVVVVMKKHFFSDQPYPKIAMKCAAWLSKLVHEGKKCWPEKEEWDVCDWLAAQPADALMEMICHADDRPEKNMSQMAKELKKFIPNTKDGDLCGTATAGI